VDVGILSMRVGLAVDSLGPSLSGIGRYTLELYRGLSSCAQIDDLLCYRDRHWFADPEILLAGDQWRRRVRFPFARQIRNWSSQRAFRDRLFHGTNFFLPESAESGIITVHDLSVLRFPETHPVERVAHFERGFLKSLDRAAHIITDSTTIRTELINELGIDRARVTSVYLGVDTSFQPSPSSTKLAEILKQYDLSRNSYILCVATLEPRKKIDRMVEAFSKWSERSSMPLQLVLVGGAGWRNEHLKDMITQKSLRPLGYVPEAHLPFIYAGARLFIYPSIYEGFGLPPIEAMAAGIPTIVSNRSCLPEITRGAAMLIDPDDIDAFSEAIERGLFDDNWRTGAIEAGYDVASGYSWEKCVKETVDVYQKVGCNE
jgi:glycosyltransferase involved in cell wall biosynthesis